MTDPRISGAKLWLRRRDYILISTALAGVVALAWAYLYYLTLDMARMAMPTMDMGTMAGMREWSTADFALMFLMWSVMMVGMMVPTAMRTVLIYASIARHATNQGTPIAATYWFAVGYLLVWTIFSLAATLVQGALDNWGLLSPMMVSTSATFGAALLIAAGLYQLTPWKDVCLKHCQSPAVYLASRFKPGIGGAIGLGFGHGVYCLGCCWAIMALLFLGGVMNLLWIAAITGFVLGEKLLPPRLRLARASGLAMVACGVVFLVYA